MSNDWGPTAFIGALVLGFILFLTSLFIWVDDETIQKISKDCYYIGHTYNHLSSPDVTDEATYCKRVLR